MCYFLTMHVIFNFHTSLCIVTFSADAFSVSNMLKYMLYSISSVPDTATNVNLRSLWSGLRVVMLYNPQSIYTSTPSNEVTEMPAAGCVFSNFPPVGWFPCALAHSMPLCAHLRCQDPVVTLRISPQSPHMHHTCCFSYKWWISYFYIYTKIRE